MILICSSLEKPQWIRCGHLHAADVSLATQNRVRTPRSL
jgi:hypothetical protein